MKAKYQQMLSEKTWREETGNISDWPGKETVTQFRQNCMAKLLHCIRILEDPYCKFCSVNEEMDRYHIQECTAIRAKASCYWEVQSSMGE